jgi:hypothetical protein
VSDGTGRDETEAALAARLRAMGGEQKDLLTRSGVDAAAGQDLETRQRQRAVFVRHADELRAMLQEEGWPTADRVGNEAARAAFVVAQHADTQLDVQRLALGLLRDAVAAGRADGQALAMLEDRVAVNEGRLQTYGTQIGEVVDGRPVPWPCVDPESLDVRRREVGLDPFEEHVGRYS